MRTIEEVKGLAVALAAAERRITKLASEVAAGVGECKRLCAVWKEAQARTRSDQVLTYGIPTGQTAEQQAAANGHHTWREAEHGLERLRRDLRAAEGDLARLEPERGEIEIVRLAESQATEAFASRATDLQGRIAAAEEVEREGDGAAVAQAVLDCRVLNASLDALEEDKGAFVALIRDRLLVAAAGEIVTSLEAAARGHVRTIEGAEGLRRYMTEFMRDGLEERFGQDIGSRVHALIKRNLADGVYHEQQPALAGGK